MNVDAISGQTATLLSAALDAAQLRHQVHAINIANANVSGYQPMRVSFGDELNRLRDAAQAGALQGAQAPQAHIEPALDALGQPAERVEIDAEVAEISRNTLHYQALLRGLSKHLSLMSLAIGDARK
jgi:flagellar basal-body rod protein FlgB